MFSTSLSLILLPLETTIHGFNVLNFTPKIRFNVLNLEKISHLERRFGALKRHMGHPCQPPQIPALTEPRVLGPALVLRRYEGQQAGVSEGPAV